MSTAQFDWSSIDPIWRDRELPQLGPDVKVTWPVVPVGALRATLGILERTVVGRAGT